MRFKEITVELVEQYLDGVLHGDEEHREWLTEATYNFWAYDRPIPTPRGSGTKDRLYQEIERLRLENENLKNGNKISTHNIGDNGSRFICITDQSQKVMTIEEFAKHLEKR